MSGNHAKGVEKVGRGNGRRKQPRKMNKYHELPYHLDFRRILPTSLAHPYAYSLFRPFFLFSTPPAAGLFANTVFPLPLLLFPFDVLGRSGPPSSRCACAAETPSFSSPNPTLVPCDTLVEIGTEGAGTGGRCAFVFEGDSCKGSSIGSCSPKPYIFMLGDGVEKTDDVEVGTMDDPDLGLALECGADVTIGAGRGICSGTTSGSITDVRAKGTGGGGAEAAELAPAFDES